MKRGEKTILRLLTVATTLVMGCKDNLSVVDETALYRLIPSKSTIYEKRTSGEIEVYTPYTLKTTSLDYEIKETGHCWSAKSFQPTLADRSVKTEDKNRTTILRGISADSSYYIEPYFKFNNGKVVYGRDLGQKTLIFRRQFCETATVKPTLKEIPFPTQINYLNWTISYWTDQDKLYALNIVGECWLYERSRKRWEFLAKLPFETKKGVFQYLVDFDGFSTRGQAYAVLTKIVDQPGLASSLRADSVQLWRLNETKKEWTQLTTLIQPVERISFAHENSGKLHFIRSYYADPWTVYKSDEYDSASNQWKSNVASSNLPVFYSRQQIGNALYMVKSRVYADGRGVIVEKDITTGTERNFELDITCSSPIIQYGGYCLAAGNQLWVAGTYLENTTASNPYHHLYVHGLARWFTPKTNEWSDTLFDIADLITLNNTTVDYPQGLATGKRFYFIDRGRQKIWEWEP